MGDRLRPYSSSHRRVIVMIGMRDSSGIQVIYQKITVLL